MKTTKTHNNAKGEFLLDLDKFLEKLAINEKPTAKEKELICNFISDKLHEKVILNSIEFNIERNVRFPDDFSSMLLERKDMLRFQTEKANEYLVEFLFYFKPEKPAEEINEATILFEHRLFKNGELTAVVVGSFIREK